MRLKITTEKIVSKNCGSPRIVKYGHYRDNQEWLCRDCGKKFTDTNAVVHGKLPSECVALHTRNLAEKPDSGNISIELICIGYPEH